MQSLTRCHAVSVTLKVTVTTNIAPTVCEAWVQVLPIDYLLQTSQQPCGAGVIIVSHFTEEMTETKECVKVTQLVSEKLVFVPRLHDLLSVYPLWSPQGSCHFSPNPGMMSMERALAGQG